MPSDAVRPGLRLVKVPDAAPPYDCPVHGARCPERAPGVPPARAGHGAPAAGRGAGGGAAGRTSRGRAA